MTEKNRQNIEIYIFHSCSLLFYLLCINGIRARTFKAHPHVILPFHVNTIFVKTANTVGTIYVDSVFRANPTIFVGHIVKAIGKLKENYEC